MIPDDVTLARLAGDFPFVVFEESPDGDVAHARPVDLPVFVAAAHAVGYDGFVGLECRPLEGELAAARRVAAADVW